MSALHKIRTARANEAGLLSALALRSKAHWGYDDEFMRSCTEELTYGEDQIKSALSIFYVCELEQQVVGFYCLEELNQSNVILEALFVEPSAMGRGVGRALLEHAKRTASQLGGESLEVQSDPQAEAFYLAMGATVIGRQQSNSIADRYLPLLSMTL